MKLRLHKSLTSQGSLAQQLPSHERPNLFGVD
jgi:hypothetical protein